MAEYKNIGGINMKKNSAVILAFMLLCTGCNADLEGTNSTDSSNFIFTDSDPTAIDGEQITAPQKTEAGLYTVNRNCFTENDLFKLFVGTPEVKEVNGFNRYILGGAKGSIGEGSINYYTEDGTNFDSAKSALEEELDDYSEYMDETADLGFATREEAKAGLMETFEMLGISPENVLITSQFSVKKSGYDKFIEIRRKKVEGSEDYWVSKAQQQLDKAAKTTGRDFYYFETTLKQEDIPTYSGKIFGLSDKPDDVVFYTRGFAVYTEKGVEYLYLIGHYKLGEPTGKTRIIDISEALKNLAEKINDSFYESEVEVYNSQLVYIGEREKDGDKILETTLLKPAYIFECRTQRTTAEGEPYTAKFFVVFDAASGKEIATSWY